MSLAFYKVLHLIGLAMTVMALGGQLFHVLGGGDKDSASHRKILAMTHGIGLLVLFVAGFGMHAKLGLEGFPGWMIAKLVLWGALGGAIAIPWRAPGMVKPLMVALPLLVGLATWLAVAKPF